MAVCMGLNSTKYGMLEYVCTLVGHLVSGPTDSSWVLGCTYRILTMQTGFALLEAGTVSDRNVANIIVKNAVDVSVGGLIYWMFGYGLAFGEPSTPFWCACFAFTANNLPSDFSKLSNKSARDMSRRIFSISVGLEAFS